ncbi:MAG: hypothetical protein IJZ23_07955 [Roseburia sp.]|nr:hypothetical protein [Roseburia sp.]
MTKRRGERNEIMVTREQAKSQLQAVGVENPTEEQITAYLNNVNAEAIKEKAKADQYKAEADKAKDLQTQLDNLQNQNLTDAEKMQKQIEALQQQNADLTANNFRTEAKAILSKAGISDEQMETLLPGLVSGVEKLEDVQTRANNFVAAMNKFREDGIKAHDQKQLDDTGTPGGNGGSDDGGTQKTEAEKFAEEYGKQSGESAKASATIVNSYLEG